MNEKTQTQTKSRNDIKEVFDVNKDTQSSFSSNGHGKTCDMINSCVTNLDLVGKKNFSKLSQISKKIAQYSFKSFRIKKNNKFQSFSIMESRNNKISKKRNRLKKIKLNKMERFLFESDSEKIIGNGKLLSFKPRFVFTLKSRKNFAKRYLEDEDFTLKLFEFIKKRTKLLSSKPFEFKCKICNVVYDNHSALGGHTSKNHPSESKDYSIRTKSLMFRKVERERNKFYKNLTKKYS